MGIAGLAISSRMLAFNALGKSSKLAMFGAVAASLGSFATYVYSIVDAYRNSNESA